MIFGYFPNVASNESSSGRNTGRTGEFGMQASYLENQRYLEGHSTRPIGMLVLFFLEIGVGPLRHLGLYQRLENYKETV